MEITLLGAVTIILAIYSFFKNEKLLLYMLVFFSTFTAATLMNIEVTTTPVTTFELFGVLWLLRVFINYIKTKPKINKETIKNGLNKLKDNKLAIAIIIFIIAIALSEISLIITRPNLEFTRVDKTEGIVKFSLGNITQSAMVVLILLVCIVLSFKIKTKDEIKCLLKVFCISSIFAVAWGLIQFIIYYFGITYPGSLFNNNPYVAQCFSQTANNVKRICSIAVEPSTFAINLICFIPFVLGAFLALKGKIKEKKYLITFAVLVITTVCAILTTSSTTYVGLIVVYGLYGLYILFGFIKNGALDARKANFLKMLAATVVSIAIAGCLCLGFMKIGYALRKY